VGCIKYKFPGSRFHWQYFYQVIENCNVAINADLPWDEAQNAAYKAECLARKASPDFAAAQDALYEIQHRASASAVKSVKTGTELIQEIWLERRKELVGEGFAAPDLLRTGSPLNRPDVAGPNWSTHLTLPAYDWRMIYPIPEAELDANDAMSDADQNEGYN